MKNRKIQKLVLISLLSLSAIAFADDTSSSGINWSGYYAGLKGGYGSGHSPTPKNYAVDPNDPGPGPGDSLDYGEFSSSHHRGSFIGGVIGYNYLLPNKFVVGLEADIVKANIDSNFMWNQDTDANSWKSKLTSFGTVRARAGYVLDQWLPFLTGGLAWGRNRLSSTCPDNSCDNLGPTTSDKRTHIGWVAGAGLEYGLNKKWSVKGEYLHIDLGSKRHNVLVDYDEGVPAGEDFGRIKFDTVNVGINYKF